MKNPEVRIKGRPPFIKPAMIRFVDEEFKKLIYV
jgi:hypothetical protein